jgi:hypothetical protein
MDIELSRFRVRKGKEQRTEEWLKTLNQRMDEVLETLTRESMMLEIIFQEFNDETMYLYWFSVRGKSTAELQTSPHEIDHIHLEFWKECIDPTYKEVIAIPKVVMMNQLLLKAVMKLE